MLAITTIVLHSLQRALSSTDSKTRDWCEKGQARIVMTIVLTGPEANNTRQGTHSPICHHSDADEQDKEENREGQQDHNEGKKTLQILYALAPRIQVDLLSLGKRPDLYDLIKDHVRLQGERVMLMCCGPAELCDSSRDAARRCDFIYFEEPFSW